MNTTTTEVQLEASFSLLVMSIASNTMMALGLTPDPQTGKSEIDTHLAKFNIDLLVTLKTKTKNNLNSEETDLLENILQDLKLKFIQK